MFLKLIKLKSILIKAIVLIVILALFIVLIVLKNDRSICEQYSRTIQRGYLFLFGHITSWIPFSMMEVLAILLGLFAIYEIVTIIKSLITLKVIKGISKASTLVLVAVSTLFLFTASFSLGYNREELVLDTYN